MCRNCPVVSLDKDHTIAQQVDVEGERIFTLFDGVHEFLDSQRELHRRCVVATAVDDSAAKIQLDKGGVNRKLQNGAFDVYGLKKLSSKPYVYVDETGSLVEFTGRWFLHDEAGFPLRVQHKVERSLEGYGHFQSRVARGVYKDFRLLRAHLAGNQGENLRMVHISDPVDLHYMKSDPETVMIRVERDGRWLTRWKIHHVLGTLLNDSGVSPGAVFDTVFADGTPVQIDSGELAKDHMAYVRSAVCTMGEMSFTLGRGKFGERIVYEK